MFSQFELILVFINLIILSFKYKTEHFLDQSIDIILLIFIILMIIILVFH